MQSHFGIPSDISLDVSIGFAKNPSHPPLYLMQHHDYIH